MGDLKKLQFTNLETDIKIGIYQLKSVMECSYAFRSWKEAESKFTISDYTCVYHIYAINSEFMLDDVFQKFNVDHPSDYTGHSLSVSDIVRVRDYEEDTDSWFYCDDIGWKDITSVCKSQVRKQKEASKSEPEIVEVNVSDYHDDDIHYHATFNDIRALTGYLGDILSDEVTDPLIHIQNMEFQEGMLYGKDETFITLKYVDLGDGVESRIPRFEIGSYVSK